MKSNYSWTQKSNNVTIFILINLGNILPQNILKTITILISLYLKGNREPIRYGNL